MKQTFASNKFKEFWRLNVLTADVKFTFSFIMKPSVTLWQLLKVQLSFGQFYKYIS